VILRVHNSRAVGKERYNCSVLHSSLRQITSQ